MLTYVAVAYGADIPRKEYPRPQMERKDWVNLNGAWSYTFDFGLSGHEREFYASKGFDGKIIVPFAPETPMSGVHHTDFINGMWYQRNITIPAEWSGRQVKLNFGAVYYMCEVYIDGQFADRHFGGTSSFSIDITKLVKAGQVHSLVVFVKNDIRDGLQASGKQNLQYSSYGCNYNRTTGIWQTVWMEPVDAKGLKQVQVLTDIDQNRVVVRPQFYTESGATLRIAVKDKGKMVAQESVLASNSSVAVIPISKPKLWSPESPNLYDVEYTVVDKDGKVLDRVESYLGMRKVHTEGNRFYLNNKPYYQRLVLDQGFYPQSNWTAPSDSALANDITLSKNAGFNGARLHQKVFEERFYYWADKMGYITWGEASSWGMDCNNEMVARNFIAEWSEIVTRDRNHPSLFVWTPLNEEFWPDRVHYPRFVADLYRVTKMLDSSRPFHDASGGVHIKTDIYTVHHYEQDPAKLREILWNGGKLFQAPIYETKLAPRNIGYNDLRFNDQYSFPNYTGDIPYMIDEFGGIKWSGVQENSSSSWGYGAPPVTLEDFYARLEGQVDAILSLSDQIWGFCYTQLTDVEQEQNGIYFYNRSEKFDMARIKKIFSKELKQTK